MTICALLAPCRAGASTPTIHTEGQAEDGQEPLGKPESLESFAVDISDQRFTELAPADFGLRTNVKFGPI